ncbi:uncharacterized protein LOC116347098 [Contarinia nasturtii]|uniref:uncharacterized protein LOC116347098 n=1 Tax=Contarinia nasturtii TaxID=265458 RepID=UPI0012D43BCE|nr:uncharacterized protein LOC116347098 [Contarinia nasturtii]
MSTTPQAALDVLLSLPKLEDFIESEAMKTAFRLKAQTKQNLFVKDPHTEALKNLFAIDRVLEAPSDRLAKLSYNVDSKFEVIVTENLNEFFQHSTWAHSSYFTDGSVRDTGSGCGFYCMRESTTFSTPLGQTTTVKQAEISAIYHCACKVLEGEMVGNVAIFTDSLGAVKELGGFTVGSGLVMTCYNALQTISETNPLRLVWVKAHSDIRGHDLADKAAKVAALCTIIGPEPVLPLEYSRVKGVLSTWLKTRSTQNWQGSFTCGQTNFFVKNPSSELTRQLLRLPRDELRTAVGILTGHAGAWILNPCLNQIFG